MADNVVLSTAVGTGDTVAADDISSVKYPRSKITLGADGVNDGDVSSANPMPVTHAALTELAAAIDTEVQVDIVGALPAGTNAIGKLAANSGVDIGDVDILSIAAGDNNIGNVDIVTVPADPFGANADAAATAGSAGSIQAKLRLMTSQLDAIKTAVETLDNAISGSEMQVDLVSANVTNAGTFATQATLTPATSGGLDTFKSTDIDETEEDVKTSAGLLYWIYCVNTNASARYLKVYNATAANVTVGTTATKLDLLVPPSNSGFFIQFPHGITFSTAISVAATTGVGDSDAGAPGANEVQVTVGYK